MRDGDKISRMTHREFLLVKLYREEYHGSEWTQQFDRVVEKYKLTQGEIDKIRTEKSAIRE